jgi:hypothetical protein
MQNNLFASLASTLADILGISQYTCDANGKINSWDD